MGPQISCPVDSPLYVPAKICQIRNSSTTAAAAQLKMHTSTTTSPPPILLTAEAARPCWPCKSKRTQNRTTVSDETTTFFAALLLLLHTARCRTSLWVSVVVHRSSSGRISFDKECCYSYLCWFHHHHTSQWAQWARNYKKMVKCLFCCAAAAAHSVWVSDLKYFCWWKNSILCIYVLKIRKPSSTISNFWHTVLMLVSSQSVLLLLFVCTTKTDFWKM